MLTLFLLLAAPDAMPSNAKAYSECVKTEITRLAANKATARENADAAITRCEPHLSPFIDAMARRFESDPEMQRRQLQAGKALPDMRVELANSTRETLRGMALRGTERLRSGQPLAGLEGRGNFVKSTPSTSGDAPKP